MTVCSEIHKLIKSIWNKGNFPRSERCQSLCLFIGRAIKWIVAIMEAYNFFNYIQNFIQHPAVQANSIYRGNYWGSSVWIPM